MPMNVCFLPCRSSHVPPLKITSQESLQFGSRGLWYHWSLQLRSTGRPLSLVSGLGRRFCGIFPDSTEAKQGQTTNNFLFKERIDRILWNRKKINWECVRVLILGVLWRHFQPYYRVQILFETYPSSVRRLVRGGKFQNFAKSSPPCVPDGSHFDRVADGKFSK